MENKESSIGDFKSVDLPTRTRNMDKARELSVGTSYDFNWSGEPGNCIGIEAENEKTKVWGLRFSRGTFVGFDDETGSLQFRGVPIYEGPYSKNPGTKEYLFFVNMSNTGMRISVSEEGGNSTDMPDWPEYI